MSYGICQFPLFLFVKYLFPFIIAAAIRGDPDTPGLEKLRRKLGLTRPAEECVTLLKELLQEQEEGKPSLSVNDPLEYLIARKDGTVHVGSTPNPMVPVPPGTFARHADI